MEKAAPSEFACESGLFLCVDLFLLLNRGVKSELGLDTVSFSATYACKHATSGWELRAAQDIFAAQVARHDNRAPVDGGERKVFDQNSDSLIPRDGTWSAPEYKCRMVDVIDAVPRISGDCCACDSDGAVEVN